MVRDASRLGLGTTRSECWRALAAAALTAASLGCESPTAQLTERVVSELYLGVFTGEGDASRYILAVGDTGYAYVDAVTMDCPWNPPPCHADAEFTVLSSNANVVSFPLPGGPFGRYAFVGKAPGSVQISAATQGLVRSARVDVMSAAPPVDSVRVRPIFWPGVDSVPVVVDEAGNLVSVTLPVLDEFQGQVIRHSLSARVVAFRGGDSTVYLPMTIGSSNPAVAWIQMFCDYWWPRCDVPGNNLVMAGVPGTTTLTVTARNQQYAFLVAVP